MEETVYTPGDFFNLPYYLQRKILLENLDLESIENLCSAVGEEERKRSGATEFFQDFCGNVQFWRDKFQNSFPRSFARVIRHAIALGQENDIEYWKKIYRDIEPFLRGAGEHFINAVYEGNEKSIRNLLEWGVDPNTRDERGNPALIRASRRRHLEVVERLLDAGAVVDARDTWGKTALMWASEGGNLELVERLLDAGAVVDARDKRGKTALMEAAYGGNLELVERLLDAGADVDARSKWGFTALMGASLGGNLEVVKHLLDAGADVNAQETPGETALMIASGQGHPKIVRQLWFEGANPDAQNEDGDTALMITMKDFSDLLEAGIENVYDRYMATIFGLIKYKPDPDIQNNEGKTAIELAEELGLDSSVVDALLYLRREKERRFYMDIG